MHLLQTSSRAVRLLTQFGARKCTRTRPPPSLSLSHSLSVRIAMMHTDIARTRAPQQRLSNKTDRHIGWCARTYQPRCSRLTLLPASSRTQAPDPHANVCGSYASWCEKCASALKSRLLSLWNSGTHTHTHTFTHTHTCHPAASGALIEYG